jgi:hypothetical protein
MPVNAQAYCRNENPFCCAPVSSSEREWKYLGIATLPMVTCPGDEAFREGIEEVFLGA